MEILVTGATGFIGFNLVNALIKKGHRVRALVRNSSQKNRTDELIKMGVSLVRGDLGDKNSLAKVVLGVEVIFHIAGVLGKFGLNDKTYFQVHIEGTKNILDVCRHNSYLKQFVFCSTVGVLGPSRERPLHETDPYNPTSIYEKTKTEAEKLVVNSIKQGFSATIIRPGLVYGPYDSHVLQMFKAIKRKRFLLISRGKNVLHPVYVDDLIKGFLLVLNNSKAFGQIYHLAGPEIIELETFFRRMAESMDLKLSWIKIPLWFAWLALYPLLFLFMVFHFEPILTKSRLRFFTQNRKYSIDKARRELDYQPRIGLEEGMQLTVEYYKKEGLLK